MSFAPHRFLGFAFASADLLVEIAPDERISFAIGAANTLTGSSERALMGQSWRDFVDLADQPLIEALFAGLEDGARQGPVLARLTRRADGPARAFSISVCRLPQNEGVVSCALTRARPIAGAPSDGLLDRDAFETITKSLIESARTGGEDLELAFLEMDGLSRATRTMSPESARTFQTRLHGALRAQSHGGAAAADLGDDRFALLRNAGESAEALSNRVSRLIALGAELGEVRVAARSLAVDGDLAPNKVARAIRYAMDDFQRDGVAATQLSTLTDAVEESVRHTLEKASALGSAVANRQFSLVYQPVVSLESGELHHHEVLVRFGDSASPFPMIRMAEELDLIESLDLAILERACGELARDPKLRLAVNVSGRSIVSETYVAAVERILSAQPALRPRLMYEVTESAAIEDLALADRHIQVLRQGGGEVCLDDFGSGAASLAYLQNLRLDLVKIDGRYIRELQQGGRETLFIRQLVNMCRELKVKTLAEMVETQTAAQAVRSAGVDYAQGWLYGAASPTPQPPISHASAARRKGVVSSWG
ncbi:EAL domain-containing protein [Caulobacter sp. KR2-114]|uniref:EAL domain-containing protein n=1 Tax=Caulobacter sp. KR2-114 TaxID=3400912 RepID=UPI003C08504D